MGLGWRIALIAVALAVATAPWDSRTTFAALLAVVPIVVWSGLLARSRRAGPAVGSVLLLLLAWIVVPRAIGWNGRWLVPSLGDMFTWYPWLAGGICALGLWIQGLRPSPGNQLPDLVFYPTAILAGMLAICATCPVWWVTRVDGPPGDETLLPLPAGLHVVDTDELCGTRSCARSVTIAGDRADARLRAHLAARGFRLRAGRVQGQQFSSGAAHDTGVLIPHHVWLSYTADAAGTVTIVWDVDPILG